MKLGLTLCILFISAGTYAQKYLARSGNVHFYSEAPVENIEANNADGKSIFDTQTGEIAFSIPIKSFEFEKSLMQEHFNENYMDSEKYPNATFKGNVLNFKRISGDQKLKAEGSMTIHGVTKQLSVEGMGNWDDDSFALKASFPVKLEDYKIKIPKIVFYNIAEIVDVTIEFNYTPYDQ